MTRLFADAEDTTYLLPNDWKPNYSNMEEFCSTIFKVFTFNNFDLV